MSTISAMRPTGDTGEILPACASRHPARDSMWRNCGHGRQAGCKPPSSTPTAWARCWSRRSRLSRQPPAIPLRWIASGKTILNNKGKPVKQYEPYFCRPAIGHRYDAAEAEHEEGVTPVMYYDAPGRLIRTEAPDGSFSRVEFSPWHVTTYDANDTVLRAGQMAPGIEPGDPAHPLRLSRTRELQRAARLAAAHANTPGTDHPRQPRA